MRITVGALAGQDYSIALPGRSSVSRLVVLLHGAGYGWEFANSADPDWDDLREMVRYLAARNYAVLCLMLYDFSLTGTEGETWGNNASTDQLASAITAAQALPGVSSGKYALVGLSMGNVTAANHARRVTQSAMAGMLGVIPASDLQTHRGTDATQGTYYASINAALGVANDSQFTTAKATYNPLAIGPSITIPWALWYNSDDTTVPSADVTALAATNPTYITATNRGTGGHDFNNVTGADVHGWLEGLSW